MEIFTSLRGGIVVEILISWSVLINFKVLTVEGGDIISHSSSS